MTDCAGQRVQRPLGKTKEQRSQAIAKTSGQEANAITACPALPGNGKIWNVHTLRGSGKPCTSPTSGWGRRFDPNGCLARDRGTEDPAEELYNVKNPGSIHEIHLHYSVLEQGTGAKARGHRLECRRRQATPPNKRHASETERCKDGSMSNMGVITMPVLTFDVLFSTESGESGGGAPCVPGADGVVAPNARIPPICLK